mmetsp:Transcript_1955/g.5177  ORF Transcript_1955/g.5177 Transcript_1955/m.5177 type:complete len:80 (+) Transcript_1955:301-540(+)
MEWWTEYECILVPILVLCALPKKYLSTKQHDEQPQVIVPVSKERTVVASDGNHLKCRLRINNHYWLLENASRRQIQKKV